jgi:hypothetical protein
MVDFNKLTSINYNNQMDKERIYRMLFASVYPLCIKKAKTKGRTKEEVCAVVSVPANNLLK